MRTLTKGLVLLALLGTLAQPPDRRSLAAAESDDPIPALVGQGRGDRIACLACGMAIIGAAGATWGGLILVSIFHPEAVGACAYICYGAFTT